MLCGRSRTAQIRARDVRPKSTAGPRSIADARNLLPVAITHGPNNPAEAMLFRQLMRTAQAIYLMHQAVVESRRASEIRNALGARLDAVRARMPELVGVVSDAAAAESPMTETLRQATGGQTGPDLQAARFRRRSRRRGRCRLRRSSVAHSVRQKRDGGEPWQSYRPM